jgi:diketogulonate reductase-like aldo/keto reductase
MPIGSTPLNDGHHIPNLAFGTGSALKGKDAQDAVTAALHAGFRHIDTAQFYRNEESVGNGLWAWLERGLVTVEGDVESNARSAGPVVVRRPKREDVWVTTKLGDGDKGALEELKESLRKVPNLSLPPASEVLLTVDSQLRLDYVDLYLIHGPWLVKGRVEVVWREMEQAREFGLAKSVPPIKQRNLRTYSDAFWDTGVLEYRISTRRNYTSYSKWRG